MRALQSTKGKGRFGGTPNRARETRAAPGRGGGPVIWPAPCFRAARRRRGASGQQRRPSQSGTVPPLRAEPYLRGWGSARPGRPARGHLPEKDQKRERPRCGAMFSYGIRQGVVNFAPQSMPWTSDSQAGKGRDLRLAFGRRRWFTHDRKNNARMRPRSYRLIRRRPARA